MLSIFADEGVGRPSDWGNIYNIVLHTIYLENLQSGIESHCEKDPC